MKAILSLELMRKSRRFHAFVMMALIPAMTFLSVPLQANPNGGVVVHGAANIQNAAANHLVINQMTSRAVINWQNFSIAQGEITQFVQPGVNSTALNRVLSGNPSEIYGQLKANGSVFVVNPNGVFVGPGGVVDVGGTVALSTLDITNEDFLDGGPNRFFGDTQTGVTNFGTISSASGDVILLGGFVDNQGQIGALNGNVALASGGDILVMDGANGQITIQGASDYEGTGVNNTGDIDAASAELKAHGNVYALAINNGGAIRATGANRSGGRVRLTSSGSSSNINLGQNSSIYARNAGGGGDVEINAGTEGDVVIGGSIDAQGISKGGSVKVVGRNVTQEQGSVINVSGFREGGSIALDAVDTMQVDGSLIANSEISSGGSVEVTATEISIGGTAIVDVDGEQEGGRIRVGGEFQGRDTYLREAEFTTVEEGAKFSADSTDGNAGSVVIWSNNDTIFRGEITASASGIIGNGGLIEVSGYDTLLFNGMVRATTVNGVSGTVLFDPGDITVGYFNNNPGANEFEISDINETLQSGTSVILATQSGFINFVDVDIPGMSAGGAVTDGELLGIGNVDINDANHPRNLSIQWTNSLASFGAFASGSIVIENHIRTSAGGDINILAGWAGSETDVVFSSGDPTAIWKFYLEDGQFGQNGGSVYVGLDTQTNHVSVGSRYGQTNVAGLSVYVTAADTNSESRWSQIGFSDSGAVFSPRFNRTDGGFDLDLNARDLELRELSGGGLARGVVRVTDQGNRIFTTYNAANDTEIAHEFVTGDYVNLDGFGGGTHGDGTYEVEVLSPTTFTLRDRNTFTFGTINGNETWEAPDMTMDNNPTVGVLGSYERDIDGDGLMDGVFGINSFGVLVDQATFNLNPGDAGYIANAVLDHDNNGTITAEEMNGTFIPYASHYNSSRVGNYWWHHIDADTPDPAGLGGLAPGNGAGTASDYANINVIAVNDVNVQSGGRHQSGAYIGHGGDSAGWADNRSVRDTTIENGEHIRVWAYNGASNDRSGMSIARLAPVYGHINVLAGVDVDSALYDTNLSSDTYGQISAEVTGNGSVNVIGQQRLNPSNSSDPNNGGAGAGTGAVIGHGGLGQYGEFYGDITVRAADDVNVIAGSHTRAIAQIGHSVSGYAYWNNTTNTADQIRFFNNWGDMNDPLLRRGELWTGTSNVDQASTVGTISPTGDTFIQTSATFGTALNGQAGNAGRPAYQDLSDPYVGAVAVEALDGSVLNGFHGNINVEAATGDVIVRGFTTPDVSDDSGNLGYIMNRDRRFAKIGHGGSSFAVGNEESGYVPNRNDRWQGRYQLWIPNGDGSNTGSGIIIGETGTAVNRSPNFTTITGDINVTAGNNVEVTAGNDTYDYGQIGHGGTELSEYETAGFIAGNITINAGGGLDINGGGIEDYTGNANGRAHRNYAMVGHGGFRTGFQYFTGDIDITLDGDLTITGGSQGDDFAKIGHGGNDSWGQVGGEFERFENFEWDGLSTDIETRIDGTTAEFIGTGGNVFNRTFELTSNTADISITAGGDIILDHLRAGLPKNANQVAANRSNNNAITDAFVQIGHGGENVDALQSNNSAYNYDDKVGDIGVSATGDITLTPGNHNGYYTRIGHGGGNEERVGATAYAMVLAGNISVFAGGTLTLDGQGRFGYFDGRDASGLNGDVETWEFENDADAGAGTGFGNPAFNNAIQIGHGAVDNGLDVVVVSDGTLVNGIAATSDISIETGADLIMKGGVGTSVVVNVSNGEIQNPSSGTHVQIGHGFGSDLGNDEARMNAIATGFTGDINVVVGRDLSMVASPNAYAYTPSNAVFSYSSGAGTFIGNGGYQLDAPAYGDISVFVGRDATISGGQRTEEDAGAGEFSRFSFAKIGHVGIENGSARFDPNNVGRSIGDTVAVGEMIGDITVVVARNLSLVGGNVSGQADADNTIQKGAFAQIGHGGPGVSGDLSGSITVLVQNDLTTTDGQIYNAPTGVSAGNNYTMIGHGDWFRDDQDIANTSLLFEGSATGTRDGNIVVAAGSDARFDHSLVGHADPLVSNADVLTGNTQVAVSRRFPFFGGSGQLEATNETVFTSADGALLQFFMPSRGQNLMEDTTRLNDDTITYVEEPGNFVGVNPALGELAGRSDEVYLTPDLWWDNAGVSAIFGFAGDASFPDDAVSGQGGAVAEVASPGGLPNVTTLLSAALGTSATTYRDASNGGSGLYTIYYDSVIPVSSSAPVPLSVVIPVVLPPFNFSGFIFAELFESFNRGEGGENGVYGDENGEVYLVIGPDEEFDGQFDDDQNSAERGLDSLFGPSREPYSDEEEEEAQRRRRLRANQGGETGSVYYLYYPGVNRYSSFRIFGTGLGFNN